MSLALNYIQPIPAAPSPLEQDRTRELVREIRALKREKRALVLCHNYQRPEVHEVADHVGDSYGLSVAASKTDCEVIVFAGVRFMAETAKILNPQKTVLLPEEMAGCALADTITAEDVRGMRRKHPGVPVVMYINCTAEVKAESDAICTSSNATHIVESIDGDPVIFGPDANLARFVQRHTKKRLISWEGYCPVHQAVTKEMLEHTMAMFPDAVVIVHPECNPDVVEMADEVLSTSQMIDAVQRRLEKKFVIGTEIGLIQRAQALCPDKEIHPIYRHKSCDESCACPFMKVTTLESIRRSLTKRTVEIHVPEEIRVRALRSVQRMLEFGLPKEKR